MNNLQGKMLLMSLAILVLVQAGSTVATIYYSVQQNELLLQVERLAFDVARQFLGL